MLAPIITKDMKLFPTRPVKNVRSRAKSMEQLQARQSSSRYGEQLRARSRPELGDKHRDTTDNCKSPPKPSINRKSTLMAIKEGVELEQPTFRHNIIAQSKSEPLHMHSRPKNVSPVCVDSEESSKESNEESSIKNEVKKKRGVLKWITNTFWKTSSSKNSDAKSTCSN